MGDNRNKGEKKKKNLKLIRFIFFIVLVFVVSGMSVVLWDKYLFPQLRSHKWLGKLAFIKMGTEDVVVINKTEQVQMNEDQNILHFVDKANSSVAEIISKKKIGKELAVPDKIRQKIGSGFFMTADGLVVTFKEAILTENADYKILAADGKSFDARLLVTDSFSNIALLKINDGSNLPIAEFVAPQDIKIGSKVIVIGKSGFDTEPSYRMGILSEKAKSFSIGGALASSEKLQGVFLLDASLERSDSEKFVGGPVVDYNGNVLGLLGMKKEDQENKYFVIPADLVQSVSDQFIQKGSLERASFGVYYNLLSRENSLSSDNKFEKGALIFSPSLQQGLAVLSGSSAEKAGLRIMDIILSVNGEEVSPNQNLAYLISKYKRGEEITLKILRDGKEMEFKAVLQ